MSKKSKYKWQVTSSESGGINVAFGRELSELRGVSDDAKMHALGKTLIKLGTQLMSSTVRTDEDRWEDE